MLRYLIIHILFQCKSDYFVIFLAKHNPGSDWSHITFAEKVGSHQFSRIALYIYLHTYVCLGCRRC